MTRGWVRAVAVAGAMAGLAGSGLAGCGIPAGTGVRVDGPLPAADSALPGRNSSPPPGPEKANDPAELVEYFLQAAAGNPKDPQTPMVDFIRGAEQADWSPDPQVLVVQAGEIRPTPDGPGKFRVTVPVREIGVLDTETGAIEPREGAEPRDLIFGVVEDPEVNTGENVTLELNGPQYRLSDLPDEMILSTRALEQEYLRPRSLYFWGSDGESLVPDLRWLPSALPDPLRAQQVLDWLQDGPAPWLPGGLLGLPDGMALAGNVVWGEDRLEVALTRPAVPEVDAARLDAQLWWTLWPELIDGRTLLLTVDGETREVDESRHRGANPATRAPPARFAVLDGVVRQHHPEEQLAVTALPEEVNQEVHRAAITGNRRFAALVQAEPDGRLQLAVAGPEGLARTGLVRDTMSRPIWLSGETVGLVAAGGRLHRFGPDAETSVVRLPGDLSGIRAVAAAPDGRRIALVAGGRLYVASLVWREGSFSVNEPRELPTGLEDLAGVGFLQENWLAIVGERDGGSELHEITVDGALERPLPEGELGVPVSVDSLVAYSGNPLQTGGARGEILYEAESRAYRYQYDLEPELIEAADLYGVPAGSEPGEPRAPFFLD